jgi:hypothetical protein
MSNLIEDFQKELKFLKHVDLVVCWKASGGFKSMFELKSFLVGTNANDRKYFGSTHSAYRVVGGIDADFELVILEDLLRFLTDPETEEARQKAVYEQS